MQQSESESGTTMEVLSVLMKQRGLKGVIALKGLPSTCKTELALRIGRWANCPVLCIQDFLGGGGGWADYFKSAKADFSPPSSTDDIERHHRKAFNALLNVAHRHLSGDVCNFVVIKLSLSIPNPIPKLEHLARAFDRGRLIIMECQISNKYLWKRRFEKFSNRYKGSKSWSRPKSWKEIDMVVDDDLPPFWDLDSDDVNDDDDDCDDDDDDDEDEDDDEESEDYNYKTSPFDHFFAWLQVDPFYNLFLGKNKAKTGPLPDEFNDAIKYLLIAPKHELPTQNPYVADYDELRRFLFHRKLRDAALKERIQSFCERDCVFKYCDEFPKYYEPSFCVVCQGQISSKPAYTCHFCVTNLHKTCAERFTDESLEFEIEDFSMCFVDQESEQYPCKVCGEGKKEFSKECRSCVFQHRFKCNLLPTIFNHNSHPHFLSLLLHKADSRCKACGLNYYNIGVRSYGCMKCAFYCHTICAFLPLELKHEHGGHEHVMKLMYTRDGMEDEEDPCWCDYCYRDMDPELWFYFCQVCPHYVVHLRCSDGYDLCFDDPKMVKFVEQLQSQLDDLRARNSIEPC